MIVMYVGCCYAKSLRSGTSILLGQVVIAYSDINGISGTYNAGRKMRETELSSLNFKGLNLSFATRPKLSVAILTQGISKI